MVNNQFIRNPEVYDVIKDIVGAMTTIETIQKTAPIINANNEPDWMKAAKKSCVHITYVNGDYSLRLKRNHEGVLVCTVCGRPINTKFDESAVKTVVDCIAVLNQALIFGMYEGLEAKYIQSLIAIKAALPEVAKIVQQLSVFVKRDNASADSADNLGVDYLLNGYRNITEM